MDKKLVAILAVVASVAAGVNFAEKLRVESELNTLRVKVSRKLATYSVTGCTIDVDKEQRDLGLLVETYNEDVVR